MDTRKIIRKRGGQWFYPCVELLFGQLLRQLVYTGLPQSLACVRTWCCGSVGRREIIQNMTILWISSILGVSKAGLSKIYPQTVKKSLSKTPHFKRCMKKAW
jgi:hypothetical protein